jgi:hypothetical protein
LCKHLLEKKLFTNKNLHIKLTTSIIFIEKIRQFYIGIPSLRTKRWKKIKLKLKLSEELRVCHPITITHKTLFIFITINLAENNLLNMLYLFYDRL